MWSWNSWVGRYTLWVYLFVWTPGRLAFVTMQSSKNLATLLVAVVAGSYMQGCSCYSGEFASMGPLPGIPDFFRCHLSHVPESVGPTMVNLLLVPVILSYMVISGTVKYSWCAATASLVLKQLPNFHTLNVENSYSPLCSLFYSHSHPSEPLQAWSWCSRLWCLHITILMKPATGRGARIVPA